MNLKKFYKKINIVSILSLILLPSLAISQDLAQKQIKTMNEIIEPGVQGMLAKILLGLTGLAGAYFGTSVAAYSVLPQSVAYLVEHGFTPLAAASAFGMTGMLSAAGILLMGWLSDRLGRKRLFWVTLATYLAGTGATAARAQQRR